jgi:hypothetical protein
MISVIIGLLSWKRSTLEDLCVGPLVELGQLQLLVLLWHSPFRVVDALEMSLENKLAFAKCFSYIPGGWVIINKHLSDLLCDFSSV